MVQKTYLFFFKILSKYDKNSFSISYSVSKSSRFYYYDGNLLNAEISEEKVNQYIEKYESSFDMLADEYANKIHQFEK